MSRRFPAQLLVTPKEVKRFVIDCMAVIGTETKHGGALADTLVAADTKGHYSHGLNRLEMYIKEVKTKACDGNATPTIVKETSSTAFVDARNGLGSVAGVFCMQLAIKKARKAGIGWITCTHSNHYGIAGFYSQMATRSGLVGMSMTNASPLMMPTRGKKRVLGTNPIAFGAPGFHGDEFMLDMSTTTVAEGKVEVNHRKQIPIPTGWAVDKDGKDTTSTSEYNDGGMLLPLGGREETSGYKGYGLATMVDVLCGVMSGGRFKERIRKWSSSEESSLGTPSESQEYIVTRKAHMFMALDPSVFINDFPSRMSGLMSDLRNQQPAVPDKPVLVAGDPERIQEKLVEQNGSITYHVSIINAMDQVADNLDVEKMERTSK